MILLILSFLIVIFIAPIIALLFFLIKKIAFLKGWIISSFILVPSVVLIVGVALIAVHFENKSHLEKAEKQYEETKDDISDDISTDHIVLSLFTTGGFGNKFTKFRRGDNPQISYVMKNHNDAAFKGTATIDLIYEGDVIDQTEIELELAPDEEKSDYISARDLNINKKIWFGIEFDYTIQGEFKE